MKCQQLLSNNKNQMQRFIEAASSIQQRVQHGTSMCPQKQYPMMLFKCGLLFNRLPDFNKIFNFFQSIEYLKAQNKLSQTFEGHLVSFLYEKPCCYSEIIEILDKIIRNKQVNVLIQLQKLQQSMQSTFQNKQDQTKHQPKHQLNEMNFNNNDYNQQKLTKCGTQVIEQNNNKVNQMDNQSQKTQKFDQQYFQNIIKMNQQSEALAKRLQQQQQKLAKSQNNKDDAVCQVCYVGLYDQQFLLLETCGHIFHKNCLSQYFKSQISQNKFPLKCPNDKCIAEVKDNDIKQILATQLYSKYEKHTLKHYADMHGDSISWCPTANCQYMFFFEKDDEVRFQCLQCKKQYCLNCRVQWHKEMSCKQFKVSSTHSEADDAFMKFVKGKKFKQCPKCKFWVQKNLGCDHMTCKCKFQFCYKCGGIYNKCQCVAKIKEEHQRRIRLNQQRRKKQIQMIERRKAKKQQLKTQTRAQRANRRKR